MSRWRVQFATGDAPQRIQDVVRQFVENNNLGVVAKVLETTNGEYFVLFSDGTAHGRLTHGLLKIIEGYIIDEETTQELKEEVK